MDNLRNIFNRGDEPQKGQSAAGNPIAGVRQQLENQVDTVVDRVASMVPGGDQYAAQCKQAISSALQSFQTNMERAAGDRLGNLNLSGLNLGSILGGSSQSTPPPPSS